MNQSRRGFFKKLAGAAAAALTLEVIDPERLLWTPGKKTIIDLGATRKILKAEDVAVADIRREFDLKGKIIAELPKEDIAKFAARDVNQWQVGQQIIQGRHTRAITPGRYRVDTVEHGRQRSATFDSDWMPTGHRGDPAKAMEITRNIFHNPALALTSGSGPRHVDMESDYRPRSVAEGDSRRFSAEDFNDRFKVQEG